MLPHPPGSCVRVFSRGTERHGDFAERPAHILNFAQSWADANIYVAPNPTSFRGGERHSAKDVTHWSYFLIDMDPVKEKYNARAALDQALLWLGEWVSRDLSNPIIIDSGRGCQAWIRLEDVPLDEDGGPGDLAAVALVRSIARRVNGYWLKRLAERLAVTHGCQIDTSVSDLPRVMRCPGTVNVKTGRMAKFLVAHDTVYHGLARMLTTGTPPTALTDPEPAEIETGQSWQMVYAHLTLTAQTYLTRGQAEPGRHKVMWHTARKLRELGVTRTEAARALRWANKLQGEDEELPADQIKHALDTAYGG